MGTDTPDPQPNHRARSRRRSLTTSPEEIAREEVEDVVAATPAERMQALIALLDSAYELWVMRDWIVTKDLADLLVSLNREGVACVVIGSITVLAHVRIGSD